MFERVAGLMKASGELRKNRVRSGFLGIVLECEILSVS